MSILKTTLHIAGKRSRTCCQLVILLAFVGIITSCLSIFYYRETVPSFFIEINRQRSIFINQEQNFSTTVEKNISTATEKNVSSTCKRCFSAEFPFTIDRPDLCAGDVDLIIAILVTAEGRSARDVVRNTWLSPVRNLPSFKNVRYFFIIGQPENEEIRQKILEESKQYKDIVVSEFKDTYRNLTIKTVVSMKWISTRCSNAKFFMKTDDDVWVNVTNLLSMLKNDGHKLHHTLGGVCRSVPVSRDVSIKWHATYEEFPKDVYDPYCSGTGYVGGIEVAKGIARIYVKIPYFYLEDVFVGICLKELGYSILYMQHFDNTAGPAFSDCKVKTGGYITVHKIPEERMARIYNATCL